MCINTKNDLTKDVFCIIVTKRKGGTTTWLLYHTTQDIQGKQSLQKEYDVLNERGFINAHPCR